MRSIVLVALVAGCSLNVDYTGTYYQCNPDGSCPSGFICESKVCVPTDPAPPACSTHVAAGEQHACAIRADGSVWCWGRNDYGQLGDNSAADHTEPVQAIGVSGAIAFGAGFEFSCATVDSGEVYCAGTNAAGQLGTERSGGSSKPVLAQTPTRALQLALGDSHACALDPNGKLWCWGANGDGSLGDGTTTNRAIPVLSRLTDAVDVAAGGEHTCAVDSKGAIRCTGFNRRGQLGDGRRITQSTPQPVPNLTTVTALSAGDDHTCALLADKTVRCFGYNADGELGDGSWINRVTPTKVVDLIDVQTISSGDNHTCAMTTGRAVYCWGDNADSQLGDRGSTSSPQPLLAGIVAPSEIDLGGNTVCTLVNGESQCWGRMYGQSAVNLHGLSGLLGIAPGSTHTCVIQNDKTVSCWGADDNGQLGDGTPNSSGTFGPTNPGVGNATAIRARDDKSCALLGDGTAKCWGYNQYGELGIGNGSTMVPTPTAVVGLSNLAQVALGGGASCARKTDGTVWCWGHNDLGAVGDGSYQNRTVPVAIGGITDAIGLAGGGAHICALKMDQTVVCWGLDASGQLGDGVQQSSSPVGVRMSCP